MIISASYRTDIPAFYGKWFQNRLQAGYCLVKNPYGGVPYRADLTGAEAFVFWTRNIGPFLPVLETLCRPFMVQFTITGYKRNLESSVIDSDAGVKQIQALANQYGPQCVVWRYDPIVITPLMDEAWHRHNFATLASLLKGSVDEVVISFMNDYVKTKRNLAMAGVEWRKLEQQQAMILANDLTIIATDHNMKLTICSDLSLADFPAAQCIDANRLSAIAGHDMRTKIKPNRPGCLCVESRDIGAYDTCVQGCRYCYAVLNPEKAKANVKKHDVSNEYL